jgi:hypothetical protein
MLGSCPNKNSDEWKEVLAEAENNEVRARELWDERYGDREDLNEPPEGATEDDFEDLEDEEVVEEPKTFADALKNIRIFLKQKQKDLAGRKLKNQTKKELELKALRKLVDDLNGVDAINAFIEDSYQKAKEISEVMANVLKNIKEGNYDRKQALDKLVAVSEFANNYSILDEINKIDVKNFFSNPVIGKPESEFTPQDKLTAAITIRNNIKAAFVDEAIPLMAEVLVNFRSTAGNKSIRENIKALQGRIKEIEDSDADDATKEKRIAREQTTLDKWQGMLLDKEKLQEVLKMAVKDESIFDFLINPLISSEDSALALFAKMIKSSFEEARMDDIVQKDDGVDQLEEFMRKTGRSVNDVAALNEGIYEVVETLSLEPNGRVKRDKETGEVIFKKQMGFVQKYDITKYNKALSEWYKNNPRPQLPEDASPVEEEVYKKAIKAWGKARSTWYALNTKPKSAEEIAAIKAEKQREVNKGIRTSEEYDEWLKTVETTDPKTGIKRFTRELAEPSDKYLNEKWQKLYDDNGNPISPQGEFHKYLTDEYFKDQELLPDNQKPGYILPSIPMSSWERMQRNGIVNATKAGVSEASVIQSWDEEYGNATLSAESQHMLPVYYTQNIDIDDVSVDLLSSVLRFGSMARRYNAMNKMNSEINAFRTIINQRATPITNAKGQALINKTAKSLGYDEYIRMNGESYSKNHLDAFLEMVVYGESQKAEKLWNLEISKLTNTAMGIAAVTTLSMDLLKGMANNIQGNIQVLIEAAGGQYFNGKNLRKGNVKYWSSVGGCISDFGKLKAESWLGKLIERYDPIQGTFKDHYGRDVSASIANKLFRSNTLFFNQNFAEHEIQVKTMLALMDGTKVFDKATGEEITLLAAHEKYGPDLFEIEKDENGKKVKKYKVELEKEDADGNMVKVDFEERDRQDVMNRLHALNKRMHGVYNDFDKATAQRYALGRLLMMYRKHMYPGIKRRYKDLSYDEELGGETEGMYRTFWRTLGRDLITYKLEVGSRWTGYTPFEKAQIRKVAMEAGIVASLGVILALLAALGGGDDDEKSEIEKTYAYNFALYQAMRMRSETLAYVSPADFYRIFKSPSAVMGTIDRATKLYSQILPWNIAEEYKRDTGIWKKGDNKAWAAFLKVMGFSGYNFTPDQAVKSFQSTFVR